MSVDWQLHSRGLVWSDASYMYYTAAVWSCVRQMTISHRSLSLCYIHVCYYMCNIFCNLFFYYHSVSSHFIRRWWMPVCRVNYRLLTVVLFFCSVTWSVKTWLSSWLSHRAVPSTHDWLEYLQLFIFKFDYSNNKHLFTTNIYHFFYCF